MWANSLGCTAALRKPGVSKRRPSKEARCTAWFDHGVISFQGSRELACAGNVTFKSGYSKDESTVWMGQLRKIREDNKVRLLRHGGCPFSGITKEKGNPRSALRTHASFSRGRFIRAVKVVGKGGIIKYQIIKKNKKHYTCQSDYILTVSLRFRKGTAPPMAALVQHPYFER